MFFKKRSVYTFQFENKTSRSLKLIIEPWASEYKVDIGMRVEIVSQEPLENIISSIQHDDSVQLYGWEGNPPTVLFENKELEEDYS